MCFFLRLIRGQQLWGIQFLFFLFLLISHREQLLLVQGNQMRDLPLIPRNRSSGGLPSTHLSRYKNSSPSHKVPLANARVTLYLSSPLQSSYFVPLAPARVTLYLYSLVTSYLSVELNYIEPPPAGILPGFPNSFSS